MPSKPIPGSTGEALTTLPSPYLPHGPTGLLYLPRFLAKCRYVKEHGASPASYAKTSSSAASIVSCACTSASIPPAVEKIVHERIDGGLGDAERDRRLAALLFRPMCRQAKWNRELTQKGTDAGRRGFSEGSADQHGLRRTASRNRRASPSLIDFDEGRIE
jgi:hypothetical protein